ncbi:MAG: dual specificity protein phosphatase family protein [Deltaproteobacteria bacterium]|nr:dual specificity protein phosphatase family protein [Deltaproteobacteria bacterium]
MDKERYRLNWITDRLAVGQAPMSYEDLESLRRQGIQAILNLCAEFCDLHWIEADSGFEVYFFPIPDEEAPDLQELEKALDWLDECLYLGKKVLVHCRHGIGRTGTVVNAYLLRKGLGHKLAGKKLKGLKSQPANFYQWWFIRKYGKKEKCLTIREPSLESKHLVDLFPFFADYEGLAEEVNNCLQRAGIKARCGQSHSDCCLEPVVTTLIEAVYISHILNTALGRVERQAAIQRAVEVIQAIRKLQQTQGIDPLSADFIETYRQAHILCPLNEWGECLIFDNRPLACRMFDMPPADRQELLKNLSRELARLSDNLFFAFTSRFPGKIALRFFLSEVVSGKFVQSFFHHLMSIQ